MGHYHFGATASGSTCPLCTIEDEQRNRDAALLSHLRSPETPTRAVARWKAGEETPGDVRAVMVWAEKIMGLLK